MRFNLVEHAIEGYDPIPMGDILATIRADHKPWRPFSWNLARGGCERSLVEEVDARFNIRDPVFDRMQKELANILVPYWGVSNKSLRMKEQYGSVNHASW